MWSLRIVRITFPKRESLCSPTILQKCFIISDRGNMFHSVFFGGGGGCCYKLPVVMKQVQHLRRDCFSPERWRYPITGAWLSAVSFTEQRRVVPQILVIYVCLCEWEIWTNSNGYLIFLAWITVWPSYVSQASVWTGECVAQRMPSYSLQSTTLDGNISTAGWIPVKFQKYCYCRSPVLSFSATTRFLNNY